MKIASLPLEDRPREKLLLHGPESLTDSELLALLLGSGTCGSSAIELSQSLLREYGGFRGLEGAYIDELLRIKGIGNGKASLVLALGEICRRAKRGSGGSLSAHLDYLRNAIGSVEEAYLFWVNAKKDVLARRLIARGNAHGLGLSVSEVLRLALSLGAKRIVLVHVHPSGFPFPSPTDISFTSSLSTKAKEVGVVLLDHVILSKEGAYSFMENGWGQV